MASHHRNGKKGSRIKASKSMVGEYIDAQMIKMYAAVKQASIQISRQLLLLSSSSRLSTSTEGAGVGSRVEGFGFEGQGPVVLFPSSCPGTTAGTDPLASSSIQNGKHNSVK